MEDTDSIKDKNALLHLYHKVLPSLATRTHENIADVTPLFHDYTLEIVLDTWSKGPDSDSDTPISMENGNVLLMGLRLKLEGFQKAGVPPFDLTQNLLFKLGRNSYEVLPDKDTIWLEKPYHQNWSEHETTELAQLWCDVVIDEITKRLESFS